MPASNRCQISRMCVLQNAATTAFSYSLNVQARKLRVVHAPNSAAMSAISCGFTACLALWGICGFVPGYERSARRARVPRRYR